MLHFLAPLIAVLLMSDWAGAQVSGGGDRGAGAGRGVGGGGGYNCPGGGGSRGRGIVRGPGAPRSDGGQVARPRGPTLPTGGYPALPAPAAGTPAVHPAGPLLDPFTLSGQEIEDLTDWRMWWELNRDAYLILGERGARQDTAGGEFYLGTGQRQTIRDRGRATRDDVLLNIVPALATVIESGGSYDLVREAIVAQAKAGRQETHFGLPFSLRHFLSENDHLVINQTAALAFGILASAEGVEDLRSLLGDTTAGRKLVRDEFVDPELRAFAAYGLGLVGQAASSDDVRHEIVSALVKTFEDPEISPELQSAVALAVGLVPLDPAPAEAFLCVCGECEVGGPATSLEAQVTWLMRSFTAERGLAETVRAQIATSLARLISHRPSQVDPFLKEGVTETLVHALEQNQRQSEVVKESAVLALGMIGDADLDPVDQWVRLALGRSACTGKPLERRFALISLALAGSRPGQGTEPFAGTAGTLNELLHHLTRGQRSVRPWAGLALGVMGHWLLFNGQELSPQAAVALKSAARGSRRVRDLGAYALAMGLRRDGAMLEFLLSALDRTRDHEARGYVALALGLIGDQAALEPLRDILGDGDTRPELREQCGAALGMLSDVKLIPLLLTELDDRRDADNCEALAVGLGGLGHPESIDALTAMLQDLELEDDVRTRAAVSLGRLADPLPLTWRSLLATGTNYHGAPQSLTNRTGTGVLNLR